MPHLEYSNRSPTIRFAQRIVGGGGGGYECGLSPKSWECLGYFRPGTMAKRPKWMAYMRLKLPNHKSQIITGSYLGIDEEDLGINMRGY